MRLLGIGEDADLAAMYHGLARAGHQVRMYVGEAASHGIYRGLVHRVHDWHDELPWIRAAGAEGVIVFESAARGCLQDTLRNEGYQVVGGSSFGDRLENDRVYGQMQLAARGLNIAHSEAFTDFAAAIRFVRERRARYVYKSNGAGSARTRNYIGQASSGEDMISVLSAHRARWAGPGAPDFVLMDFIPGVEVGVGAYFDGRQFLEPYCLDWEHKRLFTGDLGELTGEMGTVVTYRGAGRIFARTLATMQDALALSGYCGYINLNLIANSDGLWPLEFTSRFGYPGYAICEALHEETWDAILMKMVRGTGEAIRTRAGYALGVVLTVPPFPYVHGYEALSSGLPVLFDATMTDEERHLLTLAEVALEEDRLITSGRIGYVGVATGVGDSIRLASDRAYTLARKVLVPNLRYRTDIGDRVMNKDLASLTALGYLDP